jgi:hypothetical protein
MLPFSFTDICKYPILLMNKTKNTFCQIKYNGCDTFKKKKTNLRLLVNFAENRGIFLLKSALY